MAERSSAAEARGWLERLNMERIDVIERPLEVASGSGQRFLQHPLYEAGFDDALNASTMQGWPMRVMTASPSISIIDAAAAEPALCDQRVETCSGVMTCACIDISTNGGRCEWWKIRLLTCLLGSFSVTGCGNVPSRYIQQAEPSHPLPLVAAPDTYQGKTVIPGGVVVDQQQNGQRLWLHLKNRPLDKDYRPHRPTSTEGPRDIIGWSSRMSPLPPKWKQWARVTVVGRIGDQKEARPTTVPASEPVLGLVVRGWAMGNAQAGARGKRRRMPIISCPSPKASTENNRTAAGEGHLTAAALPRSGYAA